MTKEVDDKPAADPPRRYLILGAGLAALGIIACFVYRWMARRAV